MRVPFFVTGVSPSRPNGTRQGSSSHAGGLARLAGRHGYAASSSMRAVLACPRPPSVTPAAQPRHCIVSGPHAACRTVCFFPSTASASRSISGSRRPGAGKAGPSVRSRRPCRSEGARQERGGRPPIRCHVRRLCILPLPAGRPALATVALRPVALLLQSALQRAFFTISVIAEKNIVFDRA